MVGLYEWDLEMLEGLVRRGWDWGEEGGKGYVQSIDRARAVFSGSYFPFGRYPWHISRTTIVMCG